MSPKACRRRAGRAELFGETGSYLDDRGTLAAAFGGILDAADKQEVAVFTLERRWVLEFCDELARRGGSPPFTAIGRAERLDPALAPYLRRTLDAETAAALAGRWAAAMRQLVRRWAVRLRSAAPGAGEFGIAGGLTCVLVPELTREAVFQALRERRCYGTTVDHVARSPDSKPSTKICSTGSPVTLICRVTVDCRPITSHPPWSSTSDRGMITKR